MALIEDGSILMSIKKLLNVEHNDPAFDLDIGMAINAEFMTLHQLGIGPEEGFSINDADTKWADFSDDRTLIEAVKQYIFAKVRMVFDPPASSIVADAYNSRIHELEFRMNVQAERLRAESETTPIEPEDETPTPGPEPTPEPINPVQEVTEGPIAPIVTSIPEPENQNEEVTEEPVVEPIVPVAPLSAPRSVPVQNDDRGYAVQGETLQLFRQMF